MSRTPFLPGPCRGPFQPKPWCCRAPQPPWPAGVAHVVRGQWRRGADGRVCQVLGIDGERNDSAPSPERCDVNVYDPEGRRVYAVMTIYGIGRDYPEALPDRPGLPSVREGERRRAEGGVVVIVGGREADGEHGLRVVAPAPGEGAAELERETYSPAEIARLFPDVVEVETVERVPMRRGGRRASVGPRGERAFAVTRLRNFDPWTSPVLDIAAMVIGLALALLIFALTAPR